MTSYQKIIEKLKKRYESDKANIALFVTGSVARGENTDSSDLDLLLVTDSTSNFEEFNDKGIVVEIKSNTKLGFIEKMNTDPMNIYQFLDARAVFDKQNILDELQQHSKNILKSYIPPQLPRKWLDSARTKINSAKTAQDKLQLGFQTSNILWKVVEGFYILNKQPLPPSTTAFRKITSLPKLPTNFSILWIQALTGNLEERSKATLELINYLLD